MVSFLLLLFLFFFCFVFFLFPSIPFLPPLSFLAKVLSVSEEPQTHQVAYDEVELLVIWLHSQCRDDKHLQPALVYVVQRAEPENFFCAWQMRSLLRHVPRPPLFTSYYEGNLQSVTLKFHLLHSSFCLIQKNRPSEVESEGLEPHKSLWTCIEQWMLSVTEWCGRTHICIESYKV